MAPPSTQWPPSPLHLNNSEALLQYGLLYLRSPVNSVRLNEAEGALYGAGGTGHGWGLCGLVTAINTTQGFKTNLVRLERNIKYQIN